MYSPQHKFHLLTIFEFGTRKFTLLSGSKTEEQDSEESQKSQEEPQQDRDESGKIQHQAFQAVWDFFSNTESQRPFFVWSGWSVQFIPRIQMVHWPAQVDVCKSVFSRC